MESFKSYKVIPDKVFPYYKQSKKWATYLENHRWKSVQFSSGVWAFIFPSILGGLCKLQRPELVDENLLSEIDALKNEYKLFFVKLEPGKEIDQDLYTRFGYVKSDSPLNPTASLYIDLGKSEEALWKNVSRSGKYGINRSKRDGTTVKILTNPKDSDVNAYRRMLRATEFRKKFISLNYNELLSVRNSFSDESFLFLSYNKDGHLTGGRFFVSFEGIVSYITGGATNYGLHDRSGYLLFWESIRYFNEKGYRLIDLEGCYDERYPKITKDWKGFTEFKQKFGTFKVEYPGSFVKVFPKTLKFLAKYL